MTLEEAVKMKWFNWWALDIHWAFNSVKAYASRMEEQIEKMAQEDEERIRANPPDEEESGDVWGQHYWLFDETLPRGVRYSCIILLLTTIEATLLQICRQLQKSRHLPLAVGDLAGRPPVKLLTYICKVGGVDLPEHPFRATLGHLLVVRDCIAHAAGNVELMSNPSPAGVREATRQVDGFLVSGDGYIEIEKGVCAGLIEDASTWESGILDA